MRWPNKPLPNRRGPLGGQPSAWPDTTNTGPRGINAKPSPFVGSFTDYTVTDPLTANNTVDGKNVLGFIHDFATTPGDTTMTNVKFTRCQFIGNGFNLQSNKDVTFEDCEMDGNVPLGGTLGSEVIDYNGFTLRRCYVHGAYDAFHGHGDVLAEDCYVTNRADPAVGAPSDRGHQQDVYIGGANNVTPPGESAVVTFRHCTFVSDMGTYGAQAVISVLLDFVGNLDSLIIDNCYLKFIGSVGGNTLFSFYAKTNLAPSIKVRNCVIDPGSLTPATWIGSDAGATITEWTNNKFISGPNNGKTLNSDGSVT